MLFKSWKYQVISNATGKVKASFPANQDNWEKVKVRAWTEAVNLSLKYPMGDGFGVRPRIETLSHIDN